MFLAIRHRESEGSPKNRVFPRLMLALTGAALVSLMAAPSALGRQDDSQLLRQNAYSATGCPLERIAGQFVRCDTLTGAGAPAPWYVPEQP